MLLMFICFKNRGDCSVAAECTPKMTLPRSELALRSLLLNMKVLAGMRPRSRFSLLLASPEAPLFSDTIRKLEPLIDVIIVGDERGVHADALAEHAHSGKDAALILQPYHILKGSRWGGEGANEWAAIRRCLHEEDGALGLLWARASPRGAEQLSALPGEDRGAARGLLPALAPGQSPMEWVDEALPMMEEGASGTPLGYKPMKHRKFVDELRGSAEDLAPLISAVHDARYAEPLSASELMALPSPLTVKLDYHCFHTHTLKVKTPA